MPELPDLHVYCLNLNNALPERTISGARLFPGAKCNVPGEALAKRLSGFAISEVARQGKELLFTISNNSAFAVHLMLAGAMAFVDTAAADIAGRVFAVDFTDGRSLLFCDPMKKLKITLNPKPPDAPDALGRDFTLAYFLSAVKKSPWRNIKDLLLDQRVVRGIGNAYADEILWRADISPMCVCGRLPNDAAEDIYAAIPATLNWAIESIINISPDIISGEERGFLAVHHPKKDAAPDGEAILRRESGGRMTYYTKKQRLF